MDKEAFILSFWKYSYALAIRRRHLMDVDDIAQECLLAVVEMCDKAMTLDHPHAYINTALIGIANTVAHNNGIIRKPRDVARGKEEEIVIDTLTPVMSEYLEAPPMQQEIAYSWLYELINQLSPKQKESIGYRFGLLGYGYSSQSQIAKLIGSNKKAVAANQACALKKLREQLVLQH